MYNTQTHQNSRQFPTNFFSSFREKVGHFFFSVTLFPPALPISSTAFVSIRSLSKDSCYSFKKMFICLQKSPCHWKTHIDNQIRKYHHTSPRTRNFRDQQTFSTEVTNARSLGRVSSRPDHSPRRKPQKFPIGLQDPMRNTNTRSSEASLPAVFSTVARSASTDPRSLSIRCR